MADHPWEAFATCTLANLQALRVAWRRGWCECPADLLRAGEVWLRKRNGASERPARKDSWLIAAWNGLCDDQGWPQAWGATYANGFKIEVSVSGRTPLSPAGIKLIMGLAAQEADLSLPVKVGAELVSFVVPTEKAEQAFGVLLDMIREHTSEVPEDG